MCTFFALCRRHHANPSYPPTRLRYRQSTNPTIRRPIHLTFSHTHVTRRQIGRRLLLTPITYLLTPLKDLLTQPFKSLTILLRTGRAGRSWLELTRRLTT